MSRLFDCKRRGSVGFWKRNVGFKLPNVTKILVAFCMIIILTLPVFSIISIKPVFAANVTLPFQDGFESGDFSKWSVLAGGSVTSGGAHDGTYKAVFSSGYIQAVFTAAVDHCFMRAYVLLSAVNAAANTSIFGIFTSGTYMAEAMISNVSGTLKWELRYWNSNATSGGWSGYYAVSEQQKPVLNTWYCVEVEGKSNSATDSESRMYVDGTELTDVRQTGLNNTKQMTAGYLWISGSTATVWYDDVVIDTAYVGLKAGTDVIPPVFGTATANTTMAGSPCNFSCLISDDINVSKYIFSTNNTGAWTNDTVVAFSSFYSSKAAWANVTKTLNNAIGNVVSYMWYANDTTGNWGKSDQYNLTVATSQPKLFEDGFESGNFSKWTTGSGGSVTGGDAHHGTYKAVLTGQYQQKRFASGYDRLSMRAYVQFKSFPASGTSTPIFGVWNYASSRYMAVVYIANVSGTIKWELRYYDNGTSYYPVSNQQTNPSLNTWYCVEVEGVSNSATNAEARVYVNGVELTDLTQTGKNNTLQMNSGYIQASGTPTIWYDCVAIDTAYIGPECTLTVNIDGSGSVAKVPDQSFYYWGTNVSLTANPTVGWSFDHWSGDASGTINPLTINMTNDKTVNATFISGPRTIHVPSDYSTITLAIAAANAGDTILVDPGTYNEEVGINKPLTIIGSGADTTIIDGAGLTLTQGALVKITATGNVTLSGFTIRNAPVVPGSDDLRIDLLTQSSVAGVTYNISYNKIYGSNNPDEYNDYGFYASYGKEDILFTHNLVTETANNNIVCEVHTGATEISHNTLDAGVWGTDAVFIMTYDGQDVTTLQNVSYNTFDMSTGGPFDYDHRASAISFSTPGAAYGVGDAQITNVVIEGNIINNLEGYRRGIGFWNGGGGGGGIVAPLVQDNIVTGVASVTGSYGIDFIGAGAAIDAVIINNKIHDCDYGIYLRTTDCAPGAQIIYNEISGNTIGLDNTVGTSGVDARYNYWGDSTGPYNAVSNPSGLGDPVTDNVNYTPYLTSTTPALIMDPGSKTCRKTGETFTVQIKVTNAGGAEDFGFEIHYNTTLLDVESVAWNVWSGTYTLDEDNGILTGYSSGSAIGGDATLLTITYKVTYVHIWKDEKTISNWKNIQTGTIYLQTASLGYSYKQNLNYVKGGLDQITVGEDFAYAFSPIQGDIDNNGTVDIYDLRTVAGFYDQTNETYNLTGDSTVDIFDLVVVATNFGFTYS